MKKFFKVGSNKNKGLKSARTGSDASLSRRSSSISSLDFASNSHVFTSNYPKIEELLKDKHFTKLHKACYVGDLTKVERLIKKIDVNQVDSDLRTPLHLASSNAHKDVIWFLLGSKAQPNLCDSDGNTPLLKAIQCGHTEIVQFLLDRGGNPKARNKDGDTGLHLAATTGQTDIAMTLIQKRADVDARNEEGLTPLHVAVKNGQAEIFETLLRHGASVHISDNSQRTCLMLACENGSLDLVRLLLDEGVDTEACNDLGHTARDIAHRSGNYACEQLIKDAIQVPSDRKRKLSRQLQNSLIVGTPASNNTVFTEDEDEHSRISVVNSRADFDDADLDSWNDDDGSIETPSKKIVDKIGANLSKFISEIDETVSHKSGKSEVDNGSPPAKPKRTSVSTELEISPNELVTQPEQNKTMEVEHTDLTASETDETRAQRNRDLMAELGLSDISEFSSSIANSSLKKKHIVSDGEDTDHDIDIPDEDNTSKRGNYTEHKNDEDQQINVRAVATNGLQPIHGSKEVESNLKSKYSKTNESGGESDWDVSDDSLNEMIHIQPVLLPTKHSSVVGTNEKGNQLDNGTSATFSEQQNITNDEKPDEIPERNETEDEVENKSGHGDKKKANTMSSDGTLGRMGTMHEVEEVWESNQLLDLPTDDNSGSSKDEGIFHAELACVNSPEHLTKVENSQTSDLQWSKLWVHIFGKQLGAANESDSNDEASSTFAGLTDNDNCNDLPVIRDPSFNDDPSNSTSVQDDGGNLELLASFLQNPANASRVLGMIQHLRRVWNTELACCKGLTDKISLLEREVKIARKRRESSNSTNVELSSTISELKRELETVKQSLVSDHQCLQEAKLILQRKEEQTEILEDKYLKKESEHQKTELQLRALQMEAENSQLLILQLQKQHKEELSQICHIQPSMSNVAVQVEFAQHNVYSDAVSEDHKNEILRYTEEVESIRNALIQEEAGRKSAEKEARELHDQVSKYVMQLAQMEQVIKATGITSEDTTQIVKDLKEKLATSENNLRTVQKENGVCIRESEESALQLDLLRKELKTNEALLNQLKETLKHQKEQNVQLDAELFEARQSFSKMQSENLTLKLQLDSNSRLDVARQETETCLQSRWENILEKFRQDYEATEKVLSEKNHTLSKTVHSLQEELQQANERTMQTFKELNAAQLVTLQLTTKADGAIADMEKSRRKVTELQHVRDDLELRNDELKKQLKEAECCNEVKSKEIEWTTERMRKLEERLLTVDAKATMAEQELNSRRENAAEEQRSLQAQQFETNVKIKTSEEQMKIIAQKLSLAVSNTEQLEVELHKNQAQLNAANEQISILTEKLRESNKQTEQQVDVRELTKPDEPTVVFEKGFKTFHTEKMQHLDAAFVRFGQLDSNGQCAANAVAVEREPFRPDSSVVKIMSLEKDLKLLRAHMDSLLEQQRPPEDVDNLYGKSDMLWKALQEEKSKQQRSEAHMSNIQKQLVEAHSLLNHIQQFQSNYSHQNGNRHQLADRHNNCVDRAELEVLAHKLEVQSRLEINQKLEQVNLFLEEHNKLSSHKERLHSQSENQLRHEYSTAIQELKSEVDRLQKHLQDKDARQLALEEQYRELCELIEAKRRVKAKLSMDAISSPKRRTHGHILQRNSKWDVFPQHPSSTLDFGAVSSISPPNVTHSLRMIPQYCMNNMRSAKGVPDDGLSFKLREELDRSINQHLNSAPVIEIYGHNSRRPNTHNLRTAHNNEASDYLSSLKRNYLF